MTVDEILRVVQGKYPHGYSNDFMVLLLNNALKEFSRYLYKPETGTAFDIIANIPFYTMPFSPSNIIGVIVNGSEYRRDAIPGRAPGQFYYITEDSSLNLYPTPTKDSPGGLVVFHYSEPTPLSSGDLGVTPSFDPAWHMMLVYRLCKEVAEAAQDTTMVNGFVAQYNDLLEQYKRAKVYSPMTIEDVFGGMM